eukprot:scaffold10411_cov135-Skeletonema_menzelii.AAC.1
MPEVKRRELQRRKDRREKLWRGTAGENGEDADLALKRTAKKILVKQLKDWREKKLEKASVGGKGEKRSPSKRSSSVKNGTGSVGGAFAAGFTTGEEEADANIQSSTQSDEVANNDDSAVNTDSKGGNNNEDVISIKSSSGDEEEQSKPKANTIHENNNDNNDDAYESENDWEMSLAIQSSINDSIKHQKQQQIQYQDFSHQPVETIASLPSETRSQWMESQYKAQRIQSRKECIGAAANPEDYSSTQLRNFLKGSRLNQKMCEIGKLASKMGEDDNYNDDNGDNGFVDVEEMTNNGGGNRRILKRPNNTDDDSDDDILNNESAATNIVSMKVLFGDDDDDSEDEIGIEEEGGGFLLPNSEGEVNRGMKPATAPSDEIVIDDSSREDDSSTHEANDIVAVSNANAVDRNEKDCEAEVTTLPSVAARSRLLDLSSADQEWANWGEEVDAQSSTSVEQSAELTMAKAPNANSSLHESDSDDEPSFLPPRQHPKALSSLSDAAARPIAPSSKHTSQAKALDEDEAEDDIDWEDGGEVDQVDGQEENASLNKSSPPIHFQQDDNEDEEDEDIDWEDGGKDDQSGGEEDDIVVESKDNGAQQFQSKTQTHDNDDVAIFNEEDPLMNTPKVLLGDGESLNKDTFETETAIDDTKTRSDAVDREKTAFDGVDSDSDSGSDVFEMEDINSDDPTTTALRHAQETASRLTDWAGRAVQRAIAAHIEEKGGSPPKKLMGNENSQMVDLTADDGNKDEHENESDLEEIPANKIASVEDTKASSTGTQADLFDTSLEGLNKVHHEIVEEEKLMERDMSTITDEMKLDILNLLQLCGIPWIESPSEAEAQCAKLEELGLVDGIVTEDSDVFVFGGQKVYRNFFNEQKYVEAYYAKDIQKDLALGRSQLVALAMLLGGDYSDGVKGVGIVNGMEILQSFAIEDGKEGVRDGLQRFREWLDGLEDPLADEGESATFLSKVQLFHKKHKSARTRWIAPADFPSNAILDGYMKPAVDGSTGNFTWGKPDIDGLRQFCANSIGWESEETDRVVQPVLKILESGSTQTRIESYFMKYDDNIKFAEVKSKRLKAVLDNIQTGDDVEGSNKRQRSD